MNQKMQLEFYFWVLTLVVAAGILLPILSTLPEYRFLLPNIVYIVVAITMTRYLFLLKHTFLAKRQVLKVAISLLCIPLLFYLVQALNGFQTFLDEEGPEAIVGPLAYSSRSGLMTYIRSEMLLFGVASIISAFVLPFRLILSVWRTRNRGTV